MGKYLDSSGLTHLISKFKTGGINMPASTINSGTFDAARIPSLSASKITSGTIDIARLPAAALERCKIVATEDAAKLLTVNDVQLGDTVKITGTKKMYMVVDTSKLSSNGTTAGSMDAYTEYVTSTDWSTITNKPTVLTSIAHSHGLTIGSSTKSVNANSTQTWTLAEIGAAATSHKHTINDISDFPDTLKNPYTLTIALNGGTTEDTNMFTYDGSAEKSFNITAAKIGALTSIAHTHTIKIGNSSKSVSANGSQSWTLSEIGAQAAGNYLKSLTIGNSGAKTVGSDGALTFTATEIGYPTCYKSSSVSGKTSVDSVTSGIWYYVDSAAASSSAQYPSGVVVSMATSNGYMQYLINGTTIQKRTATSGSSGLTWGSWSTINDTHYTTKMVAGASNSASSNAAATSPYVNLFDNSTKRSSLQFTGSGGTTVSSDANGVITIKSNTYTSDSALTDTEIDTAIAAAT